MLFKRLGIWFGIFFLGFVAVWMIQLIQGLAESAVLKWDSPLRPFSRFWYLYVDRSLFLHWLAVFVFTAYMAYRLSRRPLIWSDAFIARRKAIVRGVVFYLGMYMFVPISIVPWIGVIQTVMLMFGLYPSNGPVSTFYVVQSVVMDVAMFTVAGAGATMIIAARILPITNRGLCWGGALAALIVLPIGRVCIIDTSLDQGIPLIVLDVIFLMLAIILWIWVKNGTFFSKSSSQLLGQDSINH